MGAPTHNCNGFAVEEGVDVAGINIAGKLKGGAAEEPVVTSIPGSSGSALDASDRLRITLLIVGILSVFAAKFFYGVLC